MPCRFKSASEMKNSRQTQEAGDRSTQFQASTINYYSGIDEQRAREICEECYDLAKNNFTAEAIQIANERVANLEEKLLERFAKTPSMFGAFADPSFQFLLSEAQKTAAKTDREVDYCLLTELLTYRVESSSDKPKCTGISKAVEIVDQISDEALQALTIIYVITQYLPVSGEPHEGIEVLGELYASLLYSELPKGNDWLDHLDILNTIRVSSLGTMGKLVELYSEALEGYIVGGFKKESEELNEVINLLNECALPLDALVEHAYNKDYVRLNVPNKMTLDDWVLVDFAGKRISLTSQQKETLITVYDMSSANKEILDENRQAFMAEWDSSDSLKIIREWWDGIEKSFEITSVGRALAHANAQRCNSAMPPLP